MGGKPANHQEIDRDDHDLRELHNQFASSPVGSYAPAKIARNLFLRQGKTMRIVYRSGDLEHVHEARSAEGRILGIIAKTLPQEVAAIARNGTEDEPEWTTKEELAAAIRAIQSRIEADPDLLFAFACSLESQGDGEPEDGQFKRGSGLSGIRLPDKPSDHVYSLWSGPGKCDLEETVIGSNGRGTIVATLDIRGEEELLTENMGRIRIHRRPVKVPIMDEFKWLLEAVESWPAGKVAKFAE